MAITPSMSSAKMSRFTVSLRPKASPLDGSRPLVPRRHGAVKVRVVGQVAADGSGVAKDLVLHHVLPRLDGAEEVGNVVGGVVVALRQRIALRRARNQRNGRRRMGRMPLLHALLPLLRGHAAPAIGFKARRYVLRRKRNRAS